MTGATKPRPEPTELGRWAITPAPMPPDAVADLVARARGARPAPPTMGGTDERRARIQAKERARGPRATSKPDKRRKGRAGEPSAISPHARAALARTAAARAGK